LKDKIVEIGGKRFTIKEVTFGEHNKILDESSVVTRDGQMKFRSGSLRTFTVFFGVKSPKMKLEDIEKLDKDTGEKLYAAIAEFNKFPLGPLRGESSSTSEESQTDKE